MLNLFYSPGACSQASHIALEEAGADYKQTLVDFKTSEQTDAGFLAINPLGRVPALATDAGILTETPAILVYIAHTNPDLNLALSDDPWAFAQVQSFNSFLASTVHVNHAHGRRGSRWADQQSSYDDMRQKLPQTMSACIQLVEDRMQTPWVMGDAYTICDPYLFTIANWLEADGVTLQNYPRVADHHTRMAARPAVIRALAKEQA